MWLELTIHSYIKLSCVIMLTAVAESLSHHTMCSLFVSFKTQLPSGQDEQQVRDQVLAALASQCSQLWAQSSTHQSQGPEGMESLVFALLVLHMELPAFINRHFLPRYSKIKAELPNLPSPRHTYSSKQDTGDTVWALRDLLSEASCYLKHTVFIKKHFPNYEMPAGMQTRKCGKADRARSAAPSNHRESTQVPGYSLTVTPKLQQLPTDFQQDMSEIKLASHYKITTKDKILSAVPSLQLFQQAEGEVCLQKNRSAP